MVLSMHRDTRYSYFFLLIFEKSSLSQDNGTINGTGVSSRDFLLCMWSSWWTVPSKFIGIGLCLDWTMTAWITVPRCNNFPYLHQDQNFKLVTHLREFIEVSQPHFFGSIWMLHPCNSYCLCPMRCSINWNSSRITFDSRMDTVILVKTMSFFKIFML